MKPPKQPEIQSIFLTKCGECGQTFDSYRSLGHHISQAHKGLSNQEYYDRHIRKDGDGRCRVCGNPTTFTGRLNRGYYAHCSRKCTALDKATVDQRKATSLSKHGSEGYNNQTQTANTKLERYGDPHYANGDKIRSTKKARYGSEGFNNPEKRKLTKAEKYGDPGFVNKEKAENTKLRKYGDRFFNNRKKAEATCLSRYNSAHYTNPEKGVSTRHAHTISKYADIVGDTCEILSINDGEFNCRCKVCGNEFSIPANTAYMRANVYGTGWCTQCNPATTSTSTEEVMLAEYVSTIANGNTVTTSDRATLDGTELDIHIPELRLAIEFDGLYWHNELRKAPGYHLWKTSECEARGIRLIHVFEDEWHFRRDIVKSRIAGILGKNVRIPARKCDVRTVPYKDAHEFIEKTHIQGDCASRWRYGLYLSGQLVAVMTFGRNRFGTGCELLRYCSALGMNIVGGASRLFTHFVNDHPDIDTVVSFADRRWSGRDAFYPKLGFVLDGETRPAYYYVVRNMRRNRMEFTKGRLVKAGFDKSMSEHDIMLSRKIYRIYDCGNFRYVWHRHPG